jgi:pimeloyl-ACP methyl ester carboxylesterase
MTASYVAVRHESRQELREDFVAENILYIHGAYASSTGFRRMVNRLPNHHAAFADYDCLTTSVEGIVHRVRSMAAKSFGGEPYSIIAHSLGGVVSLRLLASGEPVEQIFTMSAPFGGSETASVLALAFCLTPVFTDIDPFGDTIRRVLETEIAIPVRSVVSTGGRSPLMPEANDGVVTVASQTSLAGPDYHPVDYDHFEVLHADPVIDLARDFLS